MGKTIRTLEEQLDAECSAVESFVAFFKEERQFDQVVYTDWSAKDVLAHVSSWHVSFARNLMDVVERKKPSPFKGTLTHINESEVIRLASYSIEDLINQIKGAQRVIEDNICRKEVESIPYKQGSRKYGPQEHLEIVERHILGHLKDIRAIFKNNGK